MLLEFASIAVVLHYFFGWCNPLPFGHPSNLEIGINSVNVSSLEIGGLYGSAYAVYIAREYSMITVITPSIPLPFEVLTVAKLFGNHILYLLRDNYRRVSSRLTYVPADDEFELG